MNNDYLISIVGACFFPVAFLGLLLYQRWEDRHVSATIIIPDKHTRRDNELECSTHRLRRIRLSKMPEEIRQHLMGAAIRELLDLLDGKQRPWKLDYLLFGGKHGS